MAASLPWLVSRCVCAMVAISHRETRHARLGGFDEVRELSTEYCVVILPDLCRQSKQFPARLHSSAQQQTRYTG